MSGDPSTSRARDAAGARLAAAGIVVFVSHPLPELRTALRGIRETAPPDADLAVVATDLGDQDATYLLRQYLRGRLGAVEFVNSDAHGCDCGLDRVHRLVRGDYLARVDDTFEFRPGWLELAITALEDDPSLGCVSLVPPSDYHRGRGRPRTVNIEPVEVERIDMRCFVAPRALVERHECELVGDETPACRFQDVLRAEGRRLAFLPNQATPLGTVDLADSGHDTWTVEAELPPHEGASGAMQQLEQAYDLGDDVLLTCLSCGGTELETLAARIRFCERHQVPIGYWYELRCPECGELHYKDDYQFRCPD